MKKSNTEKAENLLNDAYDMYPQKHKPSKYSRDPFPMYSFERASTIFWQSFIEQLLDNGMQYEDVRKLLRSRQMRYMFDNGDEPLVNAAKIMANGFKEEGAMDQK